MTPRLLAAAVLILFLGAGSITPRAEARHRAWGDAAASPPANAAEPKTIGIIASGVDSTGIRAASDLSRLLDGDDLRVLPLLGKSEIQNLKDLLTISTVDAAIVQSDAMAQLIKTNALPGIQSRIQYVAKLYSDEFHVLSRMQFMCLADLNGRRVNFGPADSGAAITAEAVFEANHISPKPLHLDREEAIERLKKGELDALVYVGGKPSHAFDSISHKDKVHFLDVEYLPALQPSYLPAIITSEDYPNLVAPDESVATIGVSSVLATRTWPPQSERFKLMTLFVEKFFSGFDRLKGGSFSRKWAEVNLHAPVRGWPRFPAAEQWVAANGRPPAEPLAPLPAQEIKTMLRRFVESRNGTSSNQEEFFNQFVRWYREQGAEPAQH